MSKIRKINISEVEGNQNSVFPAGTIWVDLQNRLRISDGITQNGQTLSTTDLGKLKIYENILGTTDNSSGWGGYDMYLSPNGEGLAYIQLPKNDNADTFTAELYNGEAGGVKIGSANGGEVNVSLEGNTYNWYFKNDGDLKIPGNIHAATGMSITAGNNPLVANVTVNAADTYGAGVWRLFVLTNDYPTLGTTVHVGGTVTTAWGTPVTATITNITEDTDAGYWVFFFSQDVITGFSAGPKTITFGPGYKAWTFGTNGTLTFPSNSTLTAPEGAFLTTRTFSGNVYTQQNQDTNTWELYSEDDTTGPNGAWAWIKESLYTVDTPEVFIETKKGSDGVEHRWTFDANGKTTVPGAVIAGTVAKIGVDGANIGLGEAATVTASPSNNTNLNVGTVNGITFGTGFTLNVTVAENGDITAVVTYSQSGLSIGDYGIQAGGSFLGGTEGVDDITFTVASLTNVVVPTPLDLTKSINRLADGVYSLANGTEGQIMYLVPETGATYNAQEIVIANARILNSGGASTAAIYTDASYAPFSPSGGDPISNVAMLIFTDGAWQVGSGKYL